MLAVLRAGGRRPLSASRVTGARACLVRCLAVDAAEANTSDPSSSNHTPKEGWLFVDSVFPVRFGAWDFRHYIGIFREDNLTARLEEIFSAVKTHGFELLSLEPRSKDGGVFVKFKYDVTIQAASKDEAFEDILRDLKAEGEKYGGFPSWTGLKKASGDLWTVKGQPWREDLNRFASPILRVAFDGPDIREEELYEVLRPFGRIVDLTPPQPGAAGTLRYSTVTFRNVRSAVTAHNCIHGINLPVGGSLTRLRTMYERPLKAHAVRDWLTSHPRIVVPVIVFLLGTFTYTVFDPIRVFAVEGKMLDWFDYRKWSAYQWIRKNTIDRLPFSMTAQRPQGGGSSGQSIWRERQEAESDVKSYLSDFPGTISFVHGPQGSGKSSMLFSLLKDTERPVLTVDCSELYGAGSDSALLTSLARQTGYWPVFPFINSLNNLIDIGSVGLIGQKAGLSTSLEDQVREMLEVVGTGLKAVSTQKHKDAANHVKAVEKAEERRVEEMRRQAALRLGTWHDGRLDCVAGNGVMSELGIGDEPMRPEDYDVDPSVFNAQVAQLDAGKEGKVAEARSAKTPEEAQALQALPIVIIKNFATKRGRDNVLDVVAKWAATLVSNHVAHVIVVSDNRENAKSLAQALPSKPLLSIALSDADSSSALSYVLQKLGEAGAESTLEPEQRRYVERLGGRASDLESLVHKVRSGQRIEDAVEDIISRGVNELRKNAFGDDAEDAKNLPWTREQAWAVMKQLTKVNEISYHETLLEFPFKGDESALRNMEHAELITIGTRDGRPSVIKPGRPVYRYVFERLVKDPVFRATQDISSNEKRIASAESTIRTCEEELLKLNEIGTASAHWWSKRTASAIRASYLMKKLQSAEITVEKLEAANAELKKVLARSE